MYLICILRLRRCFAIEIEANWGAAELSFCALTPLWPTAYRTISRPTWITHTPACIQLSKSDLTPWLRAWNAQLSVPHIFSIPRNSPIPRFDLAYRVRPKALPRLCSILSSSPHKSHTSEQSPRYKQYVSLHVLAVSSSLRFKSTRPCFAKCYSCYLTSCSWENSLQ